METNELKNIWQTLANEKLIDKDLARENIRRIISKKGNGIINKMIKNTRFDYYLFLCGTILIPLFLLTAHLYVPAPFPNLQSYVGLSVVELFFIYMLSSSIRNRKFLSTTYNNESIKESIEKVNSYLKIYLKKYNWISLVFGYSFLTLALIQFLVKIGGFKNISFSASGFNLFSSHLIIVILALMIIWPLLIKIEIKIRYSKTVKDMKQLLDELNDEE